MVKVPAFGDSPGLACKVVECHRNDTIFSQGDTGESVMYVQRGSVKLSVLSKGGREAVVAMLGPGDFFGEGCLAGLRRRTGSATAITPSTIFEVTERHMARALREQPAVADLFVTHMLSRNLQTEQDLIDHLRNSPTIPHD